jgi:hypothetical protein
MQAMEQIALPVERKAHEKISGLARVEFPQMLDCRAPVPAIHQIFQFL